MNTIDPSRPPLSGPTRRTLSNFGFDIFEPDVDSDSDHIDDDFEFGPYEFGPYEFGPTIRERVEAWMGAGMRRLAWLGIAVAVALGSAGVVAGTSHIPGSARAELTYAADKELSAQLDDAVSKLLLTSRQVDTLGQMARNARGAVSALNKVSLGAAEDDGNRALLTIQTQVASLDRQLGCTGWTAQREIELIKVNSPSLIDRYHQICRALAAMDPLADDWRSLVAGTGTVMQVVGDINTHDVQAAAGLQAAAKGRYADALDSLTKGRAALDDASQICQQFAKLTDVSTLSKSIERYQLMDDALEMLWTQEKASGGKVTPQVQAALKVVNQRRAMLPNSNAFIAIVAYELSGQITTDAIDIEVARNDLKGQLSQLVGGSVFGGPSADAGN